MPLTEAEINSIREEAEKEYPDIFPDKFPHASRLSITTYNAARKEGYIAALTKERERVKPLVEALDKIVNFKISMSATDAYYELKIIASNAVHNHNKSLNHPK